MPPSVSIGRGIYSPLTFIAAIERAEGIKPSDVEEVFFGNVISAK